MFVDVLCNGTFGFVTGGEAIRVLVIALVVIKSVEERGLVRVDENRS